MTHKHLWTIATDHPLAGVILGAALLIVFLGWRVSVARNPMKAHWRCHGTGIRRGWVGGRRGCDCPAGPYMGLAYRIGARRR